ncbi:MAG: Phenylacetate--CoA ligase [Thermoanaerobacterales bacterium 50_218]|nr:MAG: Phenylacetate--CoA ligase [Thermoanaerobacterales bacterium 50_218]HAA90322.1 phenylacetate--CoA ligase [Peptococcaceae bacterium]
MPREQIKELQLARLKETLERVYQARGIYYQKFRQLGFEPGDLKTLDDLKKLPFTTKDDLAQAYPYGYFIVPLKDVVRLHGSSGTKGKPTIVGYTKRDLETWSELVARIVTQAGVGEDDIAQICFGYGLFTGAFGLHYGLERVGATVVPTSAGATERQLMLMQDFGTTALISTPSYALHLAEVGQELGIDFRSLKLRVGLFGAEGWTEEMRKQLEERLHLKATDNYGLSEVMGPGVAGECLETCGMHVAEDHFLVEIIDPDTGETLPEGKKGEIVITTLTREAMPLIRYRTKDVSSLHTEPCPCGRTTARLAKISGRTDDMLIIRGVNVFPSQIESVLMEINGLAPHYQIVVKKRGHLDDLEVLVEVLPEIFTDRYRDLEAWERKIERKLYNALSLTARVRLVEPRTLERTFGKAKRVLDLRNSE